MVFSSIIRIWNNVADLSGKSPESLDFPGQSQIPRSKLRGIKKDFMEYSESLKKNREFQVVYRQGTSYANRYLVMYVKENHLEKTGSEYPWVRRWEIVSSAIVWRDWSGKATV